MPPKAAAKINYDKAFLSGNVHAAITLLHDPLRSFISEKVKLFWQTSTNVTQNKPNLDCFDFSQLLRYVKKHWSQQFSLCCPPGLKKVSDNVIQIRNKISHQDFELTDYQLCMEKLAKLAYLINQREIEQKINAFLKMGIVEPDVSHGLSEKQWWQLKDEGNLCYVEERWTDAMNCYTKAIQQDSSQDVLFANRALCEMQLKNYQLAREDAEKAISLDSSKIKYYRTLSASLEKLNLYEESFEMCKNGLKVDPRDDTLLLRMRDCLAFALKSETDHKNPRLWLKEGARYQSMVEKSCKLVSKYFSDLVKLTPKPDDIEYLSESAYTKHSNLRLKLATAHRFLIDHKNDKSFEQKAFEIFETAAVQNFAEGLYNSAFLYLDGRGCSARDVAKAKDLLLKAAKHKAFIKHGDMLQPNLGVAEAENVLGNMFRDGEGEDKDDLKAFQWYLKSAEHQCAEGQNNLAYFLSNGLGCKKDLASARIWFERAAEKNIAEAQFNLADMLEAGEGGCKDLHRSHELFLAAANQGMPGAHVRLQQLTESYALGPAIKDNTQNLLIDCAIANDPHACLLQGVNYFNGEGGVEKEFVLAEKYLKKAIELGNSEAILPLSGVLFEVKRNEEAFKFIERACEVGKKEAYLSFGQFCAYGHGCDRNEERAKKWLTRANSLTENLEEETIVDVESILNRGKRIVEWELKTNNSSSGFSLAERINRYRAENTFTNIGDQEISSKLISLFEIKAPPTFDSTLKSNFNEWVPNMVKYAHDGSKSACDFLIAMDKVTDAELFISNGFYFEACETIRLANRLWDLLIFGKILVDGANKALVKNSRNSETLFFLAAVQKGNLKEKIKLVHRCIDINPTVADYHHLLGCLCGFAGCYKDALREINRALELEFCTRWLYDKATAVRYNTACKGGSNYNTKEYERAMKIIAAYETFLENNPSDHRKVPEAHFSIGSIYILMKKFEKAKEYWEKGVAAEKLRLPCFEQIDGTFPARQHLEAFMLVKQKETPVKRDVINKCAYCNGNNAKYRCSSCKCTWYCSKGCQTNDWKNHKSTCTTK